MKIYVLIILSKHVYVILSLTQSLHPKYSDKNVNLTSLTCLEIGVGLKSKSMGEAYNRVRLIIGILRYFILQHYFEYIALKNPKNSA